VHEFDEIVASLKRAAASLRDAGVPFMLAGGLASWARGGPESGNDVDFVLHEEDAERALCALAGEGMTPERPPEGWLLKAHDGEVTIDLSHAPSGGLSIDGLFERAGELSVMAQPMLVMAAGDVLATKLCGLDEHNADYASVLRVARALREQIDWHSVRRCTALSPFARAFFTLAEGLEIVPRAPATDERRIHVAPAPGSEPGHGERRAAT
jgi:hypothetical protein